MIRLLSALQNLLFDVKISEIKMARRIKLRKGLQTKFSTRQYMLSRDFEIYYYSDQGLSKVDSHTHDYYEFYFFLEGNVSLEINKQEYRLKYGDVVLIPPGVPHRAIIRNEKIPYRRFVFWISKEYCSQIMDISTDYGYLMQHVQVTKGNYIFHNDRIAFNTIQTKVIHLVEEIHGARFGKEAKVLLCVNDLLLHLNRIVYEKNQPHDAKRERSLYEEVMEYIEEHLEEDLSLDRIAGEFYASKYYISHIFKENIGLSVHQYVIKKRLRACRDAIEGTEKIREVFQRFGFKDYTSFYRAFKKEYGMSPKEYRDCRQPAEIFGEEKEGHFRF